MKIFFLPNLGTTLLASERAGEIAEEFDFDLGPEIINVTQHKYSDDLGGELILDLNTGNFKFRRSFATDRGIFIPGSLPEKETLIRDFKNFLSTKNLLKDQLQNGRGEVIYNSPTLKDATFADVSIHQEDVDGYKIVTPNFIHGLIKSQVTSETDEFSKYLSLDYIYWPVDESNVATYPVKSISSAFEELQNGLGAVIVESDKPHVSLTKIYLAYYLPEEYTPYLQPVYVFEGENFVSYIKAISSEFLTN